MSSAANPIGSALTSTSDAYDLSQAGQDAATSDSVEEAAQTVGTNYATSLIPGLGTILTAVELAQMFGRGAGLTPNQYLQQELYTEYPQYGDLSTFDDWIGPMGSEALARQNHEQSRFIAGCLNEIHVLKAKLACATTVVKKPWLHKMFGL